MELKRYQDDVLKDLDQYLDNILDTQNAALAYKKTAANGFVTMACSTPAIIKS